MRLNVDRAFLVLLAAIGLLLTGAALAPWAGSSFALLDALGFVALIIAILLTAWPLRPRVEPSPRPVTLRLHRAAGLAALVLALAHTAGFLLAEPLLVVHLLPSAPLYMLAGTVALLMLLFLSIGGLWPLRRRFHGAGRFQLLHLAAAVLLAVALALHVLGSRRYVAAGWPRGALVGASVLSLLVLLRARRHGRRASERGALARLIMDTVSVRHGRLVVSAVLAGVIVLIGLLAPLGDRSLGRTFVARAAPLPLAFPHERHRAVACITCHHNFTDRRGAGTCIACHRAATTGIVVGAEPRFHRFCEDCHENHEGPDGVRGPLRSCKGCHDPALALERDHAAG